MKRKNTIILLLLFVGIFGRSAAQELPEVRITTSFGEIGIAVDTAHAPVTAKNFLSHVKKGTYHEASFYRVVRPDNQPNNTVKIEVIQGGLKDDEKIDRIPTVAHETTEQTGLKHLDGTVSMARYTPGTASTEFFICIGDQPALDFGGMRNTDGQGFAAFGSVVEGMEVVRKIQQQKDKDQMLVEPVRILFIKIVQ